MRNIYSLLFLSLFISAATDSFSQLITVTFPDTVVYGPPVAGGDIECNEGDTIYNNTASTIDIDVVRLEDVAAAGWTSAFCLDLCYAPFVDSVRYNLPPGLHQSLIIHFYTTATADSASVYYRIKNVNVPTNTFYQRFYGITQDGFGIKEYGYTARVSVFPSPVIAGNDFCMRVSDVKNAGASITMVVYDLAGNAVYHTGVKQGINFMSIDLPSGLYSYSLISDNERIYSGKIGIAR